VTGRERVCAAPWDRKTVLRPPGHATCQSCFL
jgi:hypothetical protein